MRNYRNKNWLTRQCKKYPTAQIAKNCGVGFTTISRWLDAYGIKKIKHYNFVFDRKGSKGPYWKGGKYKDNFNGYVHIYNPNHPLANKRGYILEHRLTMEKFLRRPLRENELIHHKNGIKDDNRIENLEIVLILNNRGNHCGTIRCPFCNKNFKAK